MDFPPIFGALREPLRRLDGLNPYKPEAFAAAIKDFLELGMVARFIPRQSTMNSVETGRSLSRASTWRKMR